ncbi:MAG: acyl-CoA dehydrogenase family protein [Dehalococcoidia bacterium]|nr:acyl-CoA dehydrogenase family protein [Dehalococcoidia bacterium]MCB9483776.1 acyl-CoA dehydrogenase family protein [Dehalococcoidia bacterium]MCB9491993.1 acyl-CoA dehydrogenase family protein [Dehalococcoidia bacterium]
MDFADSPEQAAFRQEVVEFFDKNFPEELVADPNIDPRTEGRRRGGGEAMKKWRAALVEKGWIAPAWPKEYGGANLSPMEQFILNEETARRGAPTVRVPDVGSTIMVHGSEEQKKEFLPPMVRGETVWCQGYSEPGSGSDLASLQTRAVRDGDDFVINGQKIWTSGAHLANWIFALVRTDPEAPKHRGITYLLAPMDTPGISIRPLVQMNDARGFNETFFEDVRVPVKNAVGEINRGWYVGATHLDFERSSIGQSVGHTRTLGELTDFVKSTPQSRLGQVDAPRLELADRYVEAQVATLFSQRVISMQARGLIPNYEASMAKAYSTEFSQRIARTATRLLGLYGGVRGDEAHDGKNAPMGGRWATMYLSTVSATIAGGTSEIQRNVIATRGLGLPRG